MPETKLDTVAVADRLRPVLLRVGRELRREARRVGISPEQVIGSSIVTKYEMKNGSRR